MLVLAFVFFLVHPLDYIYQNLDPMKSLEHVTNLKELLKVLGKESQPTFVNLCSRCGNEHYLTDQVVSNLQTQYGEKLGYKKLPTQASAIIKAELQITKNPVLLLIEKGEIRAMFGGMVAQYRLEQALDALNNKRA